MGLVLSNAFIYYQCIRGNSWSTHLPSEEDPNLNFKIQMLDSDWLTEKCISLIGSPICMPLSSVYLLQNVDIVDIIT